jgi:hypothetical protein
VPARVAAAAQASWLAAVWMAELLAASRLNQALAPV